MRKGLVTVLLLVVGLSACNRKQIRNGTLEVSVAEYEVLSAWLDGTFARAKTQPATNVAKRIVIFDLPQSDEKHPRLEGNGQPITWKATASLLLEKAPSLEQTTIAAFREVNAEHAPFHHSFHAPLNHELVNSAQLDSFFKKGGGYWPAYYKQYPDSQGVLELSRVGFNADGTQALFYYGNTCGDLCGRGGYVVMEKRSGRWVIGKEIGMWIS